MSIFSKLRAGIISIWNSITGNTGPSTVNTVPWHLVVLLLDQLDEVDKAHTPLKEVARFLHAESRFDLKLTFLTFNDKHEYTYDPTSNRYDLHWGVLPAKWIAQIPPCSAVLALYKLNGRDPIHAGSTWGLAQGVPVNGKLRPWAAIPVDLWFYNNDPYEGFKCRSGQICTHEIVNTIRGKMEAAPYFCTLGVATNGDPAWRYETDRVRLEPGCYAALGNNED